MKILRVVGIVAGVHAFAFFVIFASPGCSSSKGQPAPGTASAPSPDTAPAPVAAAPSAIAMPAPAPVAADATSSGILYSPTRPGTPAAEALETQPVTGVTPASTYTVVSRDNLSTIAKKNHLKVSELAAANNLRTTSPLHVGQKLIIPTKAGAPAPEAAASAPTDLAAPPAAAAAEAAAAKPAGESIKYTVRPGETLGAIARKFHVKVGDVARANTISDPAKIHPGQELVIPGGTIRAGKSSAAKAAKTAASAAPAASASAPAPAPEPAAAPAPAPAANDIPVIKIDDSPPAAKP
jgi:LysM repeat protein